MHPQWLSASTDPPHPRGPHTRALDFDRSPGTLPNRQSDSCSALGAPHGEPGRPRPRRLEGRIGKTVQTRRGAAAVIGDDRCEHATVSGLSVAATWAGPAAEM